MEKNFYIETFGCQMNEYDSEKISGMLKNLDYKESKDIKSADLIIYNTCLIRENAENKLYGKLGALKKLKSEKDDLILAVGGCIPQNDEIRNYILEKYPFIDIIFGTNTFYKLPEMISKHLNNRNDVLVELENNSSSLNESLPTVRKFDHKAFINIMYGCNNFCSYCVVPHTRGRERSRGSEDILTEIKNLASQGFKEVTLLGQNVNSYGNDIDGDYKFTQLLKEVDSIDGIERIRYVSSHPKDVGDDFIDFLSRSKKVCNHIHLPIQSGSSKVLKEMNRKYSKEDYLKIINKLKKAVPNISISTDFIVGFPGETEEDFEETLEVCREAEFDAAFTFIYSIRPDTPAGKREDQIDDKVKHERFNRLLETLYPIFYEKNLAYKGKVVKVLVDEVSKSKDDYLTGRSSSNRIVHFKGSKDMIGKIVNVKITNVKTWFLEGILTEEDAYE
ncbi:MAG: tRNA (N6-isopentenyl adenosine(37)-C2)-methylthiotransferase MiaB [Bacillota bacterium]|nr:tRNA (N6-isopentenyl adenosine(37)-C2)-methylthiotransferase MiaB [Bacillota bacterium]